MNTGAGRNMNWFWKRCFFDSGEPDLAIAQVQQKNGEYQVTVEAIGAKPVPVELHITYADNTIATLHKTIAVWEQGNKTTQLSFKPYKKVTRLELKGSHIPDTDTSNNVYEVK